MYKISVPLVRFFEKREQILQELEKLGAQRVFLCPSRGFGSDKENEAELARLADAISFFESKGYEVGVWISTIGHGGELVGVQSDSKALTFTNLVGLRLKTRTDSFCPLDPEYVKAECNWVRGIARAGAKMIMLDDDFRLSSRGDDGCVCERHIKDYEKRVGEYVAPADVLKKAFSGGKNKYRDAWLEMMGDTLSNFARTLRSAADSVDPSIRMGACSCMSVWDQDGVDSIEIARILAGGNKPFMRFIGAAYWPGFWSRPCNKLQYVIELERMQRHWCEDSGIEVFGEGDVYPRPRHFIPSAYLEGFDTALRADGGFDGILKYAIDYSCSPVYETGYADRAERNKPLYSEIEKHFGGKSCVGVNVSAAMKKIADKVFYDPEKELRGTYDDGFFQPEQMILADSSIPMTYNGGNVTAVFGENARQLSDIPHTMLIDAPAAEIFAQRGIDTGFTQITKNVQGVSGEYFLDCGETTPISDATGIYNITPKSQAVVLSEFIGNSGKLPAVYNYVNSDSLRFTVLCFDAAAAAKNPRLSRDYCRQEQLVKALEWLGGEPLPAVCTGNPDLYIMCKRGENSLSVGLWNFFPDAVLTPEITLSCEYSRIEFINCSGTLCGNKVKLDCDIEAYRFAGFEVFR